MSWSPAYAYANAHGSEVKLGFYFVCLVEWAWYASCGGKLPSQGLWYSAGSGHCDTYTPMPRRQAGKERGAGESGFNVSCSSMQPTATTRAARCGSIASQQRRTNTGACEPTWKALLMCVLLGSMVKLSPKSATFAVNPRGSQLSLRSSTLRALRSLCTMLCLCRCAMARATSSAVSANGTSCTAPEADL